jgi:hypothetical protein
VRQAGAALKKPASAAVPVPAPKPAAKPATATAPAAPAKAPAPPKAATVKAPSAVHATPTKPAAPLPPPAEPTIDVELVTLPPPAPPPRIPEPEPEPDRTLFDLDQRDFIMLAAGAGGVLVAVVLGVLLAGALRPQVTEKMAEKEPAKVSEDAGK